MVRELLVQVSHVKRKRAILSNVALSDSLGLQALVLSGEMIGEALVPQLGLCVDLVITDRHETDNN